MSKKSNSETIFRRSIRNLLLKEVVVDEHAEQRLAERLTSHFEFEIGFEHAPAQYTSVGTFSFPEEIANSILDKIDILKTISFPKNKDFGVKLEAVPINPKRIAFYDGYSINSIKNKNLVLIPSGDESNGTVYYAIVRGNVMKTFMLMKSYIRVDAAKLRVDHILTDWNKIKEFQTRVKAKNDA